MNRQIEIGEYTDPLTHNFEQIEELIKEKGDIVILFTEDNQETAIVNKAFHDTGFFKEDMLLERFHLLACSSEDGLFEFRLCSGVGYMNEESKGIACSLAYLKEKSGYITTERILQEEGKRPISYTHCLFSENIKSLSEKDRYIFLILTGIFLIWNE